MNLPQITIQQLFEAAVHFGHKTSRRNPKMKNYLYGEHNSIDIIDLDKTLSLLREALEVVYKTIKNNGRILFVGTKKQGQDIIREAARSCGQNWVHWRWLGGTLTNWFTVSKSIKTLAQMEKTLEQQLELQDPDPKNETQSSSKSNISKLTKKELLDLERKKNKLDLCFGGIRDMGGKPDLLFVLDTNKEKIANQEEKKMKIPVIAILDTNSDVADIDYPIPGNDDAIRSIELYCDLISKAVLAGMHDGLVAAGIDLGDASMFNPEYITKVKAEVDAANLEKANKKKAANTAHNTNRKYDKRDDKKGQPFKKPRSSEQTKNSEAKTTE